MFHLKDRKKNNRDSFHHIYAEDERLQTAISLAKKVAATNYTVSILGESGTGKDLMSKAIHAASDRADKPFVALNCGGITESLANSELFGYEGGAYTGAKQSGHPGVFEQANNGTLFLDEIAELSMDNQTTLLRVLEDFQVKRIGSTKTVPVDVRLITATHTDLWEKVKAGTFRSDLFFRLQGVSIFLPAFRERTDRLSFAKFLLKDIANELNINNLRLSDDAVQFINNYSWPGNIRQVKSALREAAFLCQDHIITGDDFPFYIRKEHHSLPTTGSLLKDKENEVIMEVMHKTKGNISEAARILGIGRTTLYKKLQTLSEKK